MRDVSGKVAVVTGAGSGIGRALALELAAEGARLALSDIDLARVADTAASCEKAGAEAVPYQLDVASRDAVYAHATTVGQQFGGVDLVVNNAGVALASTVEEMSWDDFDWLMNINFWGVAHGTKAFLPALIASGDGHLVNVSSVFGFIGVPTQSAYNAAKFAVRGFTESLRQEMQADRRPVGVSCVHPGGIRTSIARDSRSGETVALTADDADRAFQLIARTTPQRAARTILRGVRRNKPRILVGPDAYVLDAIPRVLGARYQRPGALLARAALSLHKRIGRR